ncbi:hypothetical protein HU200_027566 [Digitaria exilis]|uniref:Uncharacterized protein n=1 Tax=Digitaria exilis TaxID=1010633 RepID=A0A835ETK2_9POAL|nr:hypothetical protein HU200_027566 [Digitaria exilis]
MFGQQTRSPEYRLAVGSTTEETPVEHPRLSSREAEGPTAPSPDPPPPTKKTTDAAAAAAATSISMACTTCGKKGDHLAADCPYKDLLDRAYMDQDDPPPAPDRASPPVCPVCRCNPDPGNRRRDDDSSLRVTNLPEAITTERDLYTLLAPFGIVLRVSLSDSEAASSNSPGRGRCGVVEFD